MVEASVAYPSLRDGPVTELPAGCTGEAHSLLSLAGGLWPHHLFFRAHAGDRFTRMRRCARARGGPIWRRGTFLLPPEASTVDSAS